jgi:uncharacterized damage-inducible protein DinB
MSEIDLFHRLFAHLEWADARTFDTLRGAPTAPPPRVLELCAHISGAELNWLARIQGRTPAAPVWPTPTMDDCAKVMRIAHDGWRKYITALTKDELGRMVHYKNSAGAEFDNRVDDILLHVSMHAACPPRRDSPADAIVHWRATFTSRSKRRTAPATCAPPCCSACAARSYSTGA